MKRVTTWKKDLQQQLQAPLTFSISHPSHMNVTELSVKQFFSFCVNMCFVLGLIERWINEKMWWGYADNEELFTFSLIKVRFIMGIFNFFLHLTFEIFVSTTNVTSSSSYFLRSALYASSKSRKNFHSFYVLFSIPLHSAEIAA